MNAKADLLGGMSLACYGRHGHAILVGGIIPTSMPKLSKRISAYPTSQGHLGTTPHSGMGLFSMETKDKSILSATGRRKEATARISLNPVGKGIITVNGRNYSDYFPTIDQRIQVEKPIKVAGLEGKIDIYAKVCGGGQSGQAGAMGLGIARCLLVLDSSLKGALRRENLLTRDPRAKERKKYGRKGARRRFQWTKR